MPNDGHAGASTLVVTNTNDSGPGSLRQAITDANATADPRDTITFNIPGAGLHTIRPPKSRSADNHAAGHHRRHDAAGLCTGTPLIEISGENAGVVNGLVITGGNSIVRGLAINRFPLSGIFVPSPGNVFESNYIGTNTAGTAAMPNGGGGIKVRGSGNHDRRNVSRGRQSHLRQPERRRRSRSRGDQQSGAGQSHRHERRGDGGDRQRLPGHLDLRRRHQQHVWRHRGGGAQHPFRQRMIGTRAERHGDDRQHGDRELHRHQRRGHRGGAQPDQRPGLRRRRHWQHGRRSPARWHAT